ncbi:hypothetical protein FOXB_16822 [Fusarium oxysporum f. sp. conglutinans Fo5176]|uniref:Uncharacterized protein n=1 Tax=Fusarium oxysporum (strain Fo5176) TaxID=660025 RepID=F9GDT8_FUSOF|nr:hypothetical protein FOXB_16822 [Fusarium oxysporum f. sp. conglutinans Fo5176]
MSTTSTTSRSSSESAATELTGASPNSPQTPSASTGLSGDFDQSKRTGSQDKKRPSVGRLGNGQCDGRDVSMSHTGSASQHASRRSSRSPLRDDQVSPSSFRHRQLGDRDQRQDGVMVIILQQLVHLNPRHQARQLAQSQDLFLAQELSHQPNLRQFLFQVRHWGR